MAIPIQLIPEIPESKLSSSVQSKLNTNGGGSSNPNIIAVTTEAALYNVANANKILAIQSNITLTANRTLPTDVIIKYGGGIVDISTFTITFVNADLADSKWDFTSGTVSTSSTFKNFHELKIDNFGAVADGKEYFDGIAVSADNTFTSATANFTSADVGKFIAIQGAHSGWVTSATTFNSIRSFITTISSVTNSTTIELTDAPTRSVSATRFIYGTDNFDVLKNISNIVNKGVRKVIFGSGTYFKREVAVEVNQNWATTPTSLTFGLGTHDIHLIGNQTIIRSIPHNRYLTFSINTKNTRRLKIEGISLQGEKPYHQYSNVNPGLGDEGVHGLHIADATINPDFSQIDIYDFEGDGVTADSDLQFTNYIKGSAALGYPGVSDFTLGTVSDTGVKTADGGAIIAYTTNLIDISKFQFENSRVLDIATRKRSYSFSGSSFAGWSGLTTPRYWVYYYDSSSTFLRKSKEQRFYEVYEFDDDVKYITITIDKPLDLTLIDAQVRSPLFAYGATFSNVNIRDCGRHGFSNLPPGTSWRDSKIQKAGPNQPGYAGNIEDYRDAAMYYLFDNIVFSDCSYGFINFVGTIAPNVTNCKFLGTSVESIDKSNIGVPSALGSSGARDSYMYGNYIRNGVVEFDRRNKFINNEMLGGWIYNQANGNTIRGNDFHNVRIQNIPQATVDREVSYFEDNKMTYDKGWSLHLISDTSNTMIYKDVEIKFNDKTRVNYQINQDSIYNPIELESGGNNKLFNASPDPTKDFGGKLINFSVSGARPNISIRDYTRSSVPIIDMDNAYFGTSIALTVGLPKDREIKDLKVSGSLRIQLDQFENSIISTTPTLKFTNLKINIEDADFDWTNTGSWVLDTASKNVNLDFYGGEMNLNLTSSVTGNYNRYMRMLHLGTTLFENFKFHSDSSKTIDFTNTAVVAAATGAITIKNPILDGTVSFTLRAGDKLLFTYPSSYCPSYADNATALAALGEGYYYKDAATGKFEVTITP